MLYFTSRINYEDGTVGRGEEVEVGGWGVLFVLLSCLVLKSFGLPHLEHKLARQPRRRCAQN